MHDLDPSPATGPLEAPHVGHRDLFQALEVVAQPVLELRLRDIRVLAAVARGAEILDIYEQERGLLGFDGHLAGERLGHGDGLSHKGLYGGAVFGRIPWLGKE